MSHKKSNLNLDLRAFVEKARNEPIEIDEIHALSLSSRCAVIRKLITAERKASNRALSASLLRLSKTFEISEGFHAWQRQKRRDFVNALTRPENILILEAYRNWAKLSLDDKQFALRYSVRLHQKTHVEGLTERLPFHHEFLEGELRHSGKSLSMTFGSFCGDLKTGNSRIRQYMLHGCLQIDPRDAFATAHHEATHLIQHHFSVAFHRHQILPSHPLYQEAAYFHAVDRHKAYIPVSYSDAYAAQPNEVFAEWEGTQISAAIESLAL